MSGKPGRSERKSFVATPEQRSNVKILVGLGVPQAMICQLVVNPQTGKPLDEGTLKKHFPRESRWAPPSCTPGWGALWWRISSG